MFKSLALFLLAASISTANAQSSDPTDTTPQSTPAPIVRTYPGNHSALRQPRLQNQIVESQPVSGIWLRSESTGAMATVSATPQRAEIRLDRGRLNVTVHHPADHAAVLIDLPGGQVSLLKDGLYTFNADTGTVRVLHGEAAAYPGPIVASANTKPIKIKEDHQLSLASATGTTSGETKSVAIKSVEAYPYELAADLLRPAYSDRGHGDRGYEYGDGYPPYYAGAWGYPYAYSGYYGYGYPFAYGLGFGYYGGFGGGFGYRGGFRR